MDVSRLVELYQERFAARAAKLKDFYDPKGATRSLVMQHAGNFVWGPCNSVPSIVENNLKQFEADIAVPWTDDLPYLEPWIGTGVYANAFGCEYVFRETAAPHVHYRHLKIEELKNVEKPDWRKSPIMNMVLDCVDALKEAGRGKLPVSLTDTQSAFDSATLILDASEFFASCYLEEEIVMNFMARINELIVEFSRVQMERVGAELLARPGHIMPSFAGGPGISISDDNLAVSSPKINELVSLPFDKMLAEAFGGLAIHSCGVWSHTMRAAIQQGGAMMLDCAIHKDCDPNPNSPAAIREALKGTNAIIKVRGGASLEDFDKALEELYDPSFRIVVQLPWSAENAERNYKHVVEKLETLASR